MTLGRLAFLASFVAFAALSLTKGTPRVIPAAPRAEVRPPAASRGPAPKTELISIAPPESDLLEAPDARALDRSLVVDLRAAARSDRTELDIRTPPEWGKPTFRRIRLHRDDVPASATPHVRAIAEVAGSAIVIVDEYESSQCVGARDAFLRVVSVAGTTTRETWRRRIARCDGSKVERGQTLAWDPLAATLHVPSRGNEAALALRIRGDGTVADGKI